MKQKNITIADYIPQVGNPPSKLPTKRELLGYMPLEKRIAELKIAGLKTAYDRDSKFYDYISGDENIELPPLPRHIPADLSEVSMLFREYQQKKREIEERLSAIQVNKKEEKIADEEKKQE